MAQSNLGFFYIKSASSQEQRGRSVRLMDYQAALKLAKKTEISLSHVIL